MGATESHQSLPLSPQPPPTSAPPTTAPPTQDTPTPTPTPTPKTALSPTDQHLLHLKLTTPHLVEVPPFPLIHRSQQIQSFLRFIHEESALPSHEHPNQFLQTAYSNYESSIREATARDGIDQNEPISWSIWQAYMNLDFAATREIMKKEARWVDMELLDKVERVFNLGVMPMGVEYFGVVGQKIEYSKKGLKTMKYFRGLRNDKAGIFSAGEMNWINATLDFIERYESYGKYHSEESFQPHVDQIIDLFKRTMKSVYGVLSPELYGKFAVVDSNSLEKKLESIGAGNRDFEFNSHVMACVRGGHLHHRTWGWLKRRISKTQDDEVGRDAALPKYRLETAEPKLPEILTATPPPYSEHPLDSKAKKSQ